MFQAVQGMWSTGMGWCLYSKRNGKKITRSNKWTRATEGTCLAPLLAVACYSSSSSSPLLSLVQVPAKLAINLSIHTQHTYDNGVDRTGDRVFRKYSFLHEEREEEKKKFLTPRLCSIWSTVWEQKKKTPQHKSTYTINTWHCNRGKHIQLWQAAIRSSAMRRRSQTCSP